MTPVKPMTNDKLKEIQMAIKNGNDLSSIIDNYDICGLDLSNAIITRMNRVNENLSNTNFYNCRIGQDGTITNLSGCNFTGCNFTGAKFFGKVWMRSTDCRNVNFNNAFIAYVEFQYADLRNATFCDAIIQFGSATSLKCKFSKKNLDLLSKYWIICED